MAKLPYLSAVIAETLRMHPAVPIMLRKLVEPPSIGGAQCASGEIIGIALPALHFSAELWQDPERFNLHRFLENNPMPLEYMPFGGAYRRCLGAEFANDELTVRSG